MSLTAVVSSTTEGISAAVARLAPTGQGAGGIFVAMALAIVLVYIDLLDASEIDDDGLRRVLLATVLPLLLTFITVVLYKSMNAIGG